MNTLQRYMDEHKLSSEQMAQELSTRMGRTISKNGVEMMAKRKEAPIPWLNALDQSPREPEKEKIAGEVKSPEISLTPLPFEIQSATMTIETLYTIAGKGAAMASKTPAVADAWAANAPTLAKAWIDWAKENKTVANGIALLTVGGPGGQVILGNATLLITTLMLISQQRNIKLIPPGFNPYEGMSEDEIRVQTEQAVDESIGNSQPPPR